MVIFKSIFLKENELRPKLTAPFDSTFKLNDYCNVTSPKIFGWRRRLQPTKIVYPKIPIIQRCIKKNIKMWVALIRTGGA